MNSKVKVLSQKDYLKKYLKKSKPKKKKSSNVRGCNVKIIDEDDSYHRENEEYLLESGDDAPVIVAVIDERPPEIRLREKFENTDRWKPLVDSAAKEQDEYSSKQAKDDLSPPRNIRHHLNDSSLLRENKHVEKLCNEEIPPLPKDRSKKKWDQDDLSPPRKTHHNEKHKHDGESSSRRAPKDLSPPRKTRHHLNDSSLLRENRHAERLSHEEISPLRKDRSKKKWYEDDLSPPRKTHRDEKYKHNGESSSRRAQKDLSPPRKSRHHSNDSSLLRENRHVEKLSDKDISPPRKERSKKKWSQELSPPRKTHRDEKHERDDWNRQATEIHSSQKSKVVKKEPFSPTKEGSSSRNPSTKSSPSRKRRQSDSHLTSRETNNFDQSAEKNSSRDHDRKPSRQPPAIVQAEQAKKKLEEDLYEMSKPLARYADDDDLDKFLREQERSEDPMFEYFQRKKMKKEAKEGKVTKPKYQGSYPQNRFGIPPGHRWDGVDRSNGYEERWFRKQNDRKAKEEEIYKWGVEDM